MLNKLEVNFAGQWAFRSRGKDLKFTVSLLFLFFEGRAEGFLDGFGVRSPGVKHLLSFILFCAGLTSNCESYGNTDEPRVL